MTSQPKRIQRRRTKGWRMPENTVYVGRGSKWGNPYRVTKQRDTISGVNVFFVDGPEGECLGSFGTEQGTDSGPQYRAQKFAAALFEQNIAPRVHGIPDALAGRNLACWCAIGQPCHADVLLEIANGTGEQS